MKRCKVRDHESAPETVCLKTCSTRIPEAQRVSLRPESPQRMLKVNSCSSTGFSLHRGTWQMPLLFNLWQCSWQVPVCSWQPLRVFAIVQSLSLVLLFGPHGLQHARLLCPSLSPRAASNSCPLSWWCHPTLSSSVARLCLAQLQKQGWFYSEASLFDL